MKFGLFMMPLHPSYREVADCYDRDIDQLVLAGNLNSPAQMIVSLPAVFPV